MFQRLTGISLAAAALAVAGCGGDEDSSTEAERPGSGGVQTTQAQPGPGAVDEPGTATPPQTDDEVSDTAPIPAQRTENLQRAVATARCTLREFPDEGAEHVEDELTPQDYKTNPPTSGKHNPIWTQDGYYPPEQTPALKNSVHALEHGRIEIQYRKDIPALRKAQLRTLFGEDLVGAGAGYHTLMFENNSGMKPAAAAVAWRASVTCDKVRASTFDAFRAFYREYVDQGPEQVP